MFADSIETSNGARKGLTGQGFEHSSHLWQEIIHEILIYVVLNKAFSIASKNKKFTINVVPVTAKSADRTLLDFDAFGESEQCSERLLSRRGYYV